jgi:hypothetical protein
VTPFWTLPAPEVVGRDSLIDDIALDHMIDRVRRIRAWTRDLHRIDEPPHPASMGDQAAFESEHGARCEIRIENQDTALHLMGTVDGVTASTTLRFPSDVVPSASIDTTVPDAILDRWDDALNRARHRLLRNLGDVQDDVHQPYREAIVDVSTLLQTVISDPAHDMVVRLHAPFPGREAEIVASNGRPILRKAVERLIVAGLPTTTMISASVPDHMRMSRVEFSASHLQIRPTSAVGTLRRLSDRNLSHLTDAFPPSTLRDLE